MFNNEFEDNNIGNEFSELIERYEAMAVSDQLSFFEEEEFEWIIEYYETRNELEKALEAAIFATRQYAYSELFLIRQAELYFEKKQINKALDLLNQAAILDATDIDIYLLRAEILTFQGKFKKAVSELKLAESLADSEDLEEVYLSLSEVYEAWEKFELVFRALKKVLELNPGNEEALNRIWFCVDMTEKYAESIELHKALIEEDPYSYLAWYNLGQAYIGLGLYEKAAEAFEYVTLINEEYDMAFRDWGEALLRMDKAEEAILVFEEALRVAEPYEEIYFGLGLCHEKLGRFSKARYYFRKALQLDPYYDEAVFRIAENFREEGKYTESLNAYKKALKLDEYNVDYIRGFAETSYLTGNVDEAVANYRKVVALKPDEPALWIDLSRLYYENGDMANAAQAAQDGLQHCPDDTALQYHLAAYQLAAGQRASGLVNLIEALQSDPAKFTLLFELHPPLLDDVEVIETVDLYRKG